MSIAEIIRRRCIATTRRQVLASAAKLPDGRIWQTQTRGYSSFGHNIEYYRRTKEGHLFVGWNTVPPRPGDLFEHPTGQGMAQFKVLEVRRERDPDDMFWALTSLQGRLIGAPS